MQRLELCSISVTTIKYAESTPSRDVEWSGGTFCALCFVTETQSKTSPCADTDLQLDTTDFVPAIFTENHIRVLLERPILSAIFNWLLST